MFSECNKKIGKKVAGITKNCRSNKPTMNGTSEGHVQDSRRLGSK